MDNLIHELTFNSYKFSFVKAMDIALKHCGIDLTALSLHDISNVNIRCNITFRSQFTEVQNVEGLLDHAPEITINLPGIASIGSIFPDAYVEDYILHNKVNGNVIEEFLNVFNYHFYSLRYFYCKKYILQYSSAHVHKTVLGKITDALSGLWQYDELLDSAMILLDIKVAAFGLFWRKKRSAFGLKSLLNSYFRVNVEVEQFIGAFSPSVDKKDRTKIGTYDGKYNKLGQDLLLGEKTWNEAAGVNVHITNLNLSQYLDFLPKISKRDQQFSLLQKMKILIKMYVPQNIRVKIIFYLSKKSNEKTILNRSKRLNQDAFLGKLAIPTTFTEAI